MYFFNHFNSDLSVYRHLINFYFYFFRLVQGICFGGEVSNLIVYILEHGQDKYLSSAKITASSTLGALLATGTSILMSHWFSHHDILDYAWRVPFIISLLSVCTSIYIRNKMEESQLFLQNKRQQKKIKMAIHFPTIVKITLAIASGSCSFYIINASISFLNTKYDVNSIYIQLFCSTFLFILILISGLVSRKMERRGISILKLGILMLIFLSIPLFYIIAQKEIISSIVALLIFIIITSMVQANIPLLALSLTKFSGRSLNLSVGYNLGIVIFGSSAPYFIHLFSQQSIGGIGYYVTIISLISYLVIVFALPKTRNTRHTITAKL